MPSYVSPGVYVVEKDVSDYPVSLNSSVVGIVGFADRGPIAGKDGKKATLITSPEALIETFGEPSESIKGQALEGALEILETTNSMYFVRCADDTATEASAAITIGGCPAIQLPTAADLGFSPGATDSGVSSVVVTVKSTTTTNSGGSPFASDKTFTIAAANTSLAANDTNYHTGLAYKKAIGGDLGDADVGVFFDTGTADTAYLVLNSAGKDAKLIAEVYLVDPNDSTNKVYTATMDPLDCSAGLLSDASAVTASGTSIDTTSVAYHVQSLFPGAGYNLGTKTNGDTSGVSFEVDERGGISFEATVNNNGEAAEGFVASFVSGAPYLENQVGTSVAKATS
ncbi:MAG: hypothetical protein VW270_30510, partial [Candidatus Poseidoniales archaeon]